MVELFSAEFCIEWTYERPEGDIVVFAKTAEEALSTIRHHGFVTTNPKKLKQTSGKLSDYLKRTEIK